jgi:hypothetical protein
LFSLKNVFKVVKLKLKFVEIVIWFEVLNVVGLRSLFFKAMLEKLLFEERPINMFVINRAYASLPVCHHVKDGC